MEDLMKVENLLHTSVNVQMFYLSVYVSLIKLHVDQES